MKINSNPDNFIPYAPNIYWDWDFTSNLRDDVTLYYGLHILKNLKHLSFEKSISSQIGGKHVYIDLELPNCLVASNSHELPIRERLFDKILTISPPFVKMSNERLGEEKYINVFYPAVNKKYIPTKFDKKYDLFYSGHIYTNMKFFSHLIKPILLENNHVCVAGGRSDRKGLNVVSANHFDKLDLNAASRITLSYDWQGGSRINGYSLSENNPMPYCYDHDNLPQWCQYKSRTFEGFLSKSVVLHYKGSKDDFRILEEFCEPDKHFIYFESLEDFREKSKYILEHYDDYKPMAEKAYQHAVENFTIESFFDKFIKEL